MARLGELKKGDCEVLLSAPPVPGTADSDDVSEVVVKSILDCSMPLSKGALVDKELSMSAIRPK